MQSVEKKKEKEFRVAKPQSNSPTALKHLLQPSPDYPSCLIQLCLSRPASSVMRGRVTQHSDRRGARRLSGKILLPSEACVWGYPRSPLSSQDGTSWNRGTWNVRNCPERIPSETWVVAGLCQWIKWQGSIERESGSNIALLNSLFKKTLPSLPLLVFCGGSPLSCSYSSHSEDWELG